MSDYWLKISRVKVFEMTVGQGWGSSGVAGGGGPNSAVTVYTLWFLVSSVMVRAPRCVRMVWTRLYLSGESWWATVMVPSPQEANARPVPGSKRLASTPLPIGTVATTFPVV